VARLVIPIKSKEQLKYVWEAESQLLKAGVTFDISGIAGEDEAIFTREWELDESLKGAEIKESGDK